MGVKISALPAVVALTGAEIVPAVQSGITSRTTTAAIAALVASGSLVFPVSTTVAGGTIDATSTIQAAIVAAIAAGGGTVYIPPGTYKVSALTLAGSGVTILGALAGNNGSLGTILLGSSTTSNVLAVSSATGFAVRNITFGRSVVASAGAGVSIGEGCTGEITGCCAINQYDGFFLGGTNQALIQNCFSTSNYRDGFHFENAASPYLPLQWFVDQCVAVFNNGYGFRTQAVSHDGGNNITVQHMNLCGTYANTLGGYIWASSTNIHHNNLTAVDCFASTDNADGFELVNPGTSLVFLGCFAELGGTAASGRSQATVATNAGAGFLITTGGVSTGFVSFNGCISRQNSFQGFLVASSCTIDHVTLTDCEAYDNGQTSNTVGIHLLNTTAKYILAGCVSKNLLFTTQTYGLLAAVGKNVSMAGCDWAGNATSGTGANDSGNMNGAACAGFAIFTQGYQSNIPIGAVAYGSLGTDLVHVAGTIYVSEMVLPQAMLVTGIAVLNGTTAATDKLILAIYPNNGGSVLGSTALAGTLASGTDAFQAIALTATLTLPAGRYWLAVQANGATTKTRRIAGSTYLNWASSFAGSFGTLGSLTPPTVPTANAGPIGFFY